MSRCRDRLKNSSSCFAEKAKIAPQRRVIFEALSQNDSHPTAEEIYQRVSSVMPDISRTTVYNTLREMVTVDALVEVEDLSGVGMRYDTNPAKIRDARWG